MELSVSCLSVVDEDRFDHVIVQAEGRGALTKRILQYRLESSKSFEPQLAAAVQAKCDDRDPQDDELPDMALNELRDRAIVEISAAALGSCQSSQHGKTNELGIARLKMPSSRARFRDLRLTAASSSEAAASSVGPSCAGLFERRVGNCASRARMLHQPSSSLFGCEIKLIEYTWTARDSRKTRPDVEQLTLREEP